MTLSLKIQIPESQPLRDSTAPIDSGKLVTLSPETVERLLRSPHLSVAAKVYAQQVGRYGLWQLDEANEARMLPGRER